MRKVQGREERNHNYCMNAHTHAVLLVLHFLSIENYSKLFISCSQFVYSCNCRGFFTVSCIFIREPTGRGKAVCRFYKCIGDITSRKLHNSQTGISLCTMSGGFSDTPGPWLLRKLHLKKSPCQWAAASMVIRPPVRLLRFRQIRASTTRLPDRWRCDPVPCRFALRFLCHSGSGRRRHRRGGHPPGTPS